MTKVNDQGKPRAEPGVGFHATKAFSITCASSTCQVPLARRDIDRQFTSNRLTNRPTLETGIRVA